MKRFDCIWLVTEDGSDGEIMITECVDRIIISATYGHWNFDNETTNLFVQEYQTYESAYRVALDMREGNPRCYGL